MLNSKLYSHLTVSLVEQGQYPEKPLKLLRNYVFSPLIYCITIIDNFIIVSEFHLQSQ